MKVLLGLVGVVLVAMVGAGGSIALAAAPAAARPSITITNPKSGAVIHGDKITVQVAVSNFTLVDSTTHPRSKGNQGHIQYVLDNVTTYSADHNVASSLSHTWTHVKPGHHTLIAYLATSQQLPFPTARQSEVTVTVAAPRSRPGGGAATTPARPTTPARQPRSPGVGAAPTTGGGAGTVSGPLNVYMLIFGIFLLAVGLLFLGRRYAFATTGGRMPRASDHLPIPEARVTFEPQPAGSVPTQSADSAPQPGPGLARFGAPPASPQEALAGESASVPALVRQDVDSIAVPEPLVRPAVWDAPPVPSALAGLPVMDPPSQSSPPPVAPWVGADSSDPADLTRTRALEMAQQWSSVVADLVHQIERQEAEHREMLARIDSLERAVRAHEALRNVLSQSSLDQLTEDDMRAIQYVTDSLLSDPDHIVVLAAVAQHAGQLARVVNNYARIQRALREA